MTREQPRRIAWTITVTDSSSAGQSRAIRSSQAVSVVSAAFRINCENTTGSQFHPCSERVAGACAARQDNDAGPRSRKTPSNRGTRAPDFKSSGSRAHYFASYVLRLVHPLDANVRVLAACGGAHSPRRWAPMRSRVEVAFHRAPG